MNYNYREQPPDYVMKMVTVAVDKHAIPYPLKTKYIKEKEAHL